VSRKYGLDFINGHMGFEHHLTIARQNTNHLHGVDPTGGNVGFLDGHAEWRRFNPEMDPNGVTVPRFNDPYRHNGAFFW